MPGKCAAVTQAIDRQPRQNSVAVATRTTAATTKALISIPPQLEVGKPCPLLSPKIVWNLHPPYSTSCGSQQVPRFRHHLHLRESAASSSLLHWLGTSEHSEHNEVHRASAGALQ